MKMSFKSSNFPTDHQSFSQSIYFNDHMIRALGSN
jgi:hypothetical protein